MGEGVVVNETAVRREWCGGGEGKEVGKQKIFRHKFALSKSRNGDLRAGLGHGFSRARVISAREATKKTTTQILAATSKFSLFRRAAAYL